MQLTTQITLLGESLFCSEYHCLSRLNNAQLFVASFALTEKRQQGNTLISLLYAKRKENKIKINNQVVYPFAVSKQLSHTFAESARVLCTCSIVQFP